MHEKPSYNEETTLTATVSSNCIITVCCYQYPWILSKTKADKRFIAVVKGRSSTLTKATLMTRTSSTRVANIFINDWVANFRIMFKALTDIGP